MSRSLCDWPAIVHMKSLDIEISFLGSRIRLSIVLKDALHLLDVREVTNHAV
jgi:hypothetical protein